MPWCTASNDEIRTLGSLFEQNHGTFCFQEMIFLYLWVKPSLALKRMPAKENNRRKHFLKFNELDLLPELLKSVKDMGFEETTPIQEQTIPLA